MKRVLVARRDSLLAREVGYPPATPWRWDRPDRILCVWDGQPKRPPRRGEWFLSGAVIQGYLAEQDLETPYPIAVPWRVERTETIALVERFE